MSTENQCDPNTVTHILHTLCFIATVSQKLYALHFTTNNEAFAVKKTKEKVTFLDEKR